MTSYIFYAIRYRGITGNSHLDMHKYLSAYICEPGDNSTG